MFSNCITWLYPAFLQFLSRTIIENKSEKSWRLNLSQVSISIWRGVLFVYCLVTHFGFTGAWLLNCWIIGISFVSLSLICLVLEIALSWRIPGHLERNVLEISFSRKRGSFVSSVLPDNFDFHLFWFLKLIHYPVLLKFVIEYHPWLDFFCISVCFSLLGGMTGLTPNWVFEVQIFKSLFH